MASQYRGYGLLLNGSWFGITLACQSGKNFRGKSEFSKCHVSMCNLNSGKEALFYPRTAFGVVYFVIGSIRTLSQRRKCVKRRGFGLYRFEAILLLGARSQNYACRHRLMKIKAL